MLALLLSVRRWFGLLTEQEQLDEAIAASEVRRARYSTPEGRHLPDLLRALLPLLDRPPWEDVTAQHNPRFDGPLPTVQQPELFYDAELVRDYTPEDHRFVRDHPTTSGSPDSEAELWAQRCWFEAISCYGLDTINIDWKGGDEGDCFAEVAARIGVGQPAVSALSERVQRMQADNRDDEWDDWTRRVIDAFTRVLEAEGAGVYEAEFQHDSFHLVVAAPHNKAAVDAIVAQLRLPQQHNRRVCPISPWLLAHSDVAPLNTAEVVLQGQAVAVL